MTVGTFDGLTARSPHMVVKINNKIYQLDHPNFLQSLQLTRRAESIGEFEIVMVDLQDLDLEAKLIQAIQSPELNPISFQYGWGLSPGKMSTWYKGTLISYNAQFLPNLGLTLTLRGIVSEKFGLEITKTYRGMRISDIVQQIADDEGWTMTKIDETEEFSEEREFHQQNQTSIEFIRQTLVPEANKEEFPVRFFHSTTAGEGMTCSFVKTDPQNPTVTSSEFNFMLNSGNFGNVISFSPNYEGAQLAALNTQIGFVDRETNDMVVYQNQGSNIAGSDKLLPQNIPYGATTPDMMGSILQNHWYGKNIGGYDATLVIVGDPDVIPLDYINIIPIRPDGKMHHTGGIYQVIEVVDNIQGAYETTIQCVKIPDMEYDISKTLI
ncbi:baseplate protein [Listeria phage LIS04]|nr:baseplate protein [Listeria phage LIS04]